MTRSRRPNRVGAKKPMLGRKGVQHPRSLYDEAQRAKAVEMYVLDGWSYSRIARELGCHRFTVRRWVEESQQGETP